MEHIEEPLERPKDGSSSSRPRDGQLSFFPEEQPPDPDEQRLTLLALSQIKGLGEASLKGILSRFPNLNAVWEAPPAELQEAPVGAGLRNWRSVVNEVSAGVRSCWKRLAAPSTLWRSATLGSSSIMTSIIRSGSLRRRTRPAGSS